MRIHSLVCPGRVSPHRRWLGTLLLALLLLPAGCSRQETAAQRPMPPVLAAKLKKKLSKRPNLRGRFDKPAEALRFFLSKRLPRGQSALNTQAYVDAAAAAQEMPVYSTALNGMIYPTARLNGTVTGAASGDAERDLAVGTWQPLGPGNIGGRSRSLLIHPTRPSTVWTAGVAGGVWKSTDGGASWVPKGDLLVNIAINSLILDPRNPDILYAGTGEGFFNGDAVRGAGVFKSLDGGETWAQLPSTANPNFYYVNKLAVTRGSAQRIYAATRAGVFRSSDNGATWTQVLNPNVVGGCLDVVIQTDRALAFVFAACGTFVQSAVWRALDTGATQNWAVAFSPPNMGRTTLALAPSNQSIVYALAASVDYSSVFGDGLLGVYRSNSSGAPGSWLTQVTNQSPVKLNTLLLTNPVFASLVECGYGDQNFYFNQGWYDNQIAVDPANPDIVWAAGIDLFRSDDGGRNWGMASHWWVQPDPDYAHADNHVLAFHPQYDGSANRTLYVGSDGGVFRTLDARGPVGTAPDAPCHYSPNGRPWTALNNGYQVTQFYHGLPYPDGTAFLGGTQDNGTVRGSLAGGTDGWRDIHGGDGGYVAIDPANTSILYAEFTGLSLEKSVDGGANWADATRGIDPNDLYLFIAPFAMDPNNSQVLWHGGTKAFRTVNGAASWVQASATFGPPNEPFFSGVVSAIGVTPGNGNRVYYGTSPSGLLNAGGGFIHRTTTALTATAATVWPRTRPRRGYVSWIEVDPRNQNTVYATYSTFDEPGSVGHVFRSTDGGVTFVNIDGTGLSRIPDVPVHTIKVDPANSSRLYVGTDIGVFVSINGGASWFRENTGFANVITEALAFNTIGTPRLHAFTHGRSAWRVNLVP